MKRWIAWALSCLSIISTSAHADCWNNGERDQSVSVLLGANRLDSWKVTSAEIRRIRLPNAFEVGIQIEPATREKYEELLAKLNAISEMVKITLYDMSVEPPRMLTYTWGGSNSFQDYGARGGADRVVQLGDPGIRLALFKPVCVTRESLAAGK